MIEQMLAEIVSAHRERAVVRVGDVFLKVETDADRAARELAALGTESIPTPRLLWQRPGEPHLLALSEVGGQPLAALGAPSGHTREAWFAAGSTASRLHRTPVPPQLKTSSRYLLEDLDKLERWAQSSSVAPSAVVAAHATRARAARDAGSQDALVHGDLQAAHVFITEHDEVAAVIDWGDAGLGDPHYDLAVLTVGHSEQLNAVLEGYGGDVDVDRIRGYWSWRRLGSIRWMIEHGFDASGDITALSHTV